MGANVAPSTTLVPNEQVAMTRSHDRQKTNVSSSSSKQGSIMSRRNTEHTIVDLSKIADVSADPQKLGGANITKENIPSTMTNEGSAAPFTNSKSMETILDNSGKAGETIIPIPGEQMESTIGQSGKITSLSTNDRNSGEFMNNENTEHSMTDAEKSEEMQAEESTSFLQRETESGSGEGSFDMTNADESTDKITVENETVGAMNTYIRKSAMKGPGRKAHRLSFIDSAHVIQINSSKESHMRAMPSEKFWRRNQRRVSSMPALDEGQLKQV